MNYIIWTKDGYADTWKRQDAGDKPVAKRIILEEMKEGRQPILTLEVPFDLQLNVGEPGVETRNTAKEKYRAEAKKPKEEGQVETIKSETKPDQNPGD